MKQHGAIMLIELAIVTTIAIAMASGQLWVKRQQMLSALRAAQGTLLSNIGHGYNQYIIHHYSALLNGQSIPGITDPYAPTIDELKASGDLDARFSSTSLFGSLPYAATIFRSPIDCTPPACNISGLVYINGSITDPSTGMPQPLGDALLALGGDGAFSDRITPNTLNGLNEGWSSPNPVGHAPSVLAMRIGYGTSGFAQFVRKDGSIPMEGDLNFQGTDGIQHNINHAHLVNAEMVNTKTVKTNDLNAGGRIRAGEYIQIDGLASDGEHCSQNGLLGQDGSGLLLSCQSGVWQSSQVNLRQNKCSWLKIPCGDNGCNGNFSGVCPVHTYVAGYMNYRGGDWTRTGHAGIYCCSP